MYILHYPQGGVVGIWMFFVKNSKKRGQSVNFLEKSSKKNQKIAYSVLKPF